MSDNGAAFDPLSVPAPDLTTSLDERAVGGLGLHLVRNLMDRVSYSRAGERNQLTLVKAL